VLKKMPKYRDIKIKTPPTTSLPYVLKKMPKYRDIKIKTPPTTSLPRL